MHDADATSPTPHSAEILRLRSLALAPLRMTGGKSEPSIDPVSTSKTYWVYVLTNAKTTVLYVGMTNDLGRRLAEHEAAADPTAFTARYRARRLVYAEAYPDPRDAIAREKQIKGWRRAKKRALVDAANPAWRDLRESRA